MQSPKLKTDDSHNFAAVTEGKIQKPPPERFEDESYFSGTMPSTESSSRSLRDSIARSFRSKRSSEHSSNSLTNSLRASTNRIFRRRRGLRTEISSRLVNSKTGSIRSNKNVLGLTANKLRFGNVGFYGRKNEISKLLNILRRSSINHASSSSKSKELVLLHGYSGVGKTAIASHFGEAVMMVESGVYATGKFHLNDVKEPYQAISTAYGEVFSQIMNKDEAKNIQRDILENLGTEAKLLNFLVPGLQELLSRQFDENSPVRYNPKSQYVKEETSDPKAMCERLKFAFRVLNRILTTHISPLAIVLDDLQWADVASMKIIETLISDNQNPNSLLIIGMYRSNEVNESHILSTTIRRLKEDNDSSSLFSITEMEVSNLGLDEVCKTIMALLSIDNTFEIYELAELCYRRTLGNPFFLIKFMKMLEEKELLEFNLGLFRWSWDLAKIEEETASTANVVDLLQVQMKEMPLKIQVFLFYSACLGSAFRVKELEIVLKHLDYQYLDEVPKILSNLEEQFFIEPSSFDWNNFESGAALMTYRWVHDKVQEAALSLVNDEQELAKQHFKMGMALYTELSKEEIDKVILYVATMINYGLKSGKKSLDFAELNLRAAEKAKSVSAFQTAATYASAGIDFLPANYWTANRSLAIQLYSIGAEMFSPIGDMEKMNLYCDFILESECLAIEKLRVCKVKANSLARAERNYGEAIKVCVKQLKELGFYIPENVGAIAFKAIAGVLSTAKASKKDSRVNMSVITDCKILGIMELLDRLYYFSYMSSNTMLFLLTLTKIIQLTNLHGICNFSPSAFVVWGMIQGSILGKVRAGHQSAEKAMRMQERLPSKEVEGATICRAHILVFHRSTLIHDSLKHLTERAYKCAMKSGDVETATLAFVAGEVSIPFVLGKALNGIGKGCELGISQAKQLAAFDNVLYLQMLHQLVMNLEGRTENNFLLKGPVFDEDEVNLSTPIDRVSMNYFKSFLFAVFAEYELGAALALKKGSEFSKEVPGHLCIIHDTFLRGVSLYAMARKTKRRKFKRGAKEIRKFMKHCLKEGNPNVKHYTCLFDAEQAVLDKKYDAAENHYREGIRITARGGYQHDSGILSERYAEFLMNVVSEQKEGKAQIEKAARFYKEYGAIQKAKLLENGEGIPSQLFREEPLS